MHLSIGALRVAHFLATAPVGVGLTIPEEICPKADRPSIHRELTAAGLIVNDDRSSVHAGFATLPTSVVRLRALARHYRRAAIQLEIMRRISEAPNQGSTNDHFSELTIEGEQATHAECERAVTQLRQWNLVAGHPEWHGSLVEPSLTNDGYEVLESELSPQVWIQENRQGDGNMTNYSISQTFQGNVGAVQNGDNATANVVQNNGFDAQSFASILTEIRKTISAADLDPDTTEAANTQLDLIQQQAEAGKSPGVIKTFFNGLASTLPAALASEIAGQVGNAIDMLTQMPPIA